MKKGLANLIFSVVILVPSLLFFAFCGARPLYELFAFNLDEGFLVSLITIPISLVIFLISITYFIIALTKYIKINQ